MFTIIGIVIGLVILLMIIKYITGKSKRSDQRSALESLAVSIGTIFRRNTNDLARAARTPEVMKEEAMQEVNDAIRKLNQGYEESKVRLKCVLLDLQNVQLPKLKDAPGSLEQKARSSKKKWEESKSSEGGEIVKYKENAIRFLQMKKKAIENLDKVEKTITKIKVALDTSQAQYDMDRTELQMIKSELECMVSIPQLQVQSAVNRIQSIQNELTSRVNEENIRAEVVAEINGAESPTTTDMEDEFNNL